MKFYSGIFRFLALIILSATTVGCHHIDNKRLPAMPVNITFADAGMWDKYGITGAGLYRRFIIQEKIPADFPYFASSATGFGGVLLCSMYTGVPVAYDLACPVECRANVRVYVNESGEAECPECHSRYDIFEKYGYPVAGKAAVEGFGLETYNVVSGLGGYYMVITR